MKNRQDAVNFIHHQLYIHDKPRTTSRHKGDYWHYGLQELRELLDFIYLRQPIHEFEDILSSHSWTEREAAKKKQSNQQ